MMATPLRLVIITLLFWFFLLTNVFADTTNINAENIASMCAEIPTADFSSLADASTHISSSTFETAKEEIPSHCNIEGYVSPSVGFVLRLPLNWNGKFFASGCGGFCGTTSHSLQYCKNALQKGYACIASDMGHKGSDGKWAFNNLQGEIDFGYRATHVVTLAGKAITEYYYGQSPDYAYFMGCSTGGRQGLIEAQRFPDDFDGIVSGMPPLHYAFNSMNLLWYGLAATDQQGSPTLDEPAIKRLHQAVISACDLDDGLKDGIIGHPTACDFDPQSLVCSGRENDQCLSQNEIKTVKKIYSGATTSSGEKLYFGAMPGSELNWLRTIFNFQEGASRLQKSRVEQFRYMFLWPDPGPVWQASDFDFDHDYKRLAMKEAFYNAANPDLRPFKAAGGKFILYQGWNDELAAPLASVDYYNTVEKTMGGRASTQDFFRLFMLPGANHCWGGDGAYAVDYLSYLEAWVERGEAPEKLMSAHIKPAGYADISPLTNPENILFTRPVYPYPIRAKYKGSGNGHKAENFVPINDSLNHIGNGR